MALAVTGLTTQTATFLDDRTPFLKVVDTYFEPNKTFPEFAKYAEEPPDRSPRRPSAKNAAPNYELSKILERELVQTARHARSRAIEKLHEA